MRNSNYKFSLFLFCLAFTILFSCESTPQTEAKKTEEIFRHTAPPLKGYKGAYLPLWAKNSNVYNVNLRQFTKEGNFNAFKNDHIDRLKKMGVDILSFMPVFPISEQNKKGTLGKQWMKIGLKNNSKRNIFIRVLFKILPWEMAHFGIHWSVYYDTNGLEIPLWNWVVNILPQVIILFYFITIVLSNGKSSIYDKIAKTRIETFNTQ